MSKIVTIVGARPQFVKAAVVSKALNNAGIAETIIHTGQHYDYNMSSIFWDELGIPAPEKNLEVGSGNHGTQTGFMMQKLEEYILSSKTPPRALMVYGDTNSTLAGSLVAAKLNIPVIHVEAGLRSHNREMPEEINRVVTDHVSNLLFCSSEESIKELNREGITEGVHVVGDVMHDALLTFSEKAEEMFTLRDIIPGVHGEFVLATIHRPSNTDQAENLKAILQAFGEIEKTIVWPVHPRNKATITNLDIPDNLVLTDPVSYFKMMILLGNCSLVITDSGGLQKEAYWMKKRCITVRNETEWVETLSGGWNTLTGADTSKILAAVVKDPETNWKPLYGDGKAANQITKIIKEELF
ncbi:MAG: UDP-N-acetylglucosamine 2-epimerase (non-hydrolyzing) [Balneolaceae bacterium]|nr:UDP-N-acetylglucosamine 2-epimerase (non-hydrolyzing) [Balneolaceae bacterium]